MSLQTWLERFFACRDYKRTTEGRYRWAVRTFEKWLGRPATCEDLADGLNQFLRSRAGNRHTTKSLRAALGVILRCATRRGLAKKTKVRQVRCPDVIPRA